MTYLLTAETNDGEFLNIPDGIKTNFAYLVQRAKETIQNSLVKNVEILDEHGVSKLLIEK